MPKQLLKQYALEVRKYEASLVFRGLPKGSMVKFTDLVTQISTENSGAIQIDDESFTAFGVDQVPAIVLAQAAPIFEGQTRSEKFDKVTGSLTIKAALELFASKGEMSKEARELLR